MEYVKLVIIILVLTALLAVFFYRLGQSGVGLKTSKFLPILVGLLLISVGLIYHQYYYYPEYQKQKEIANRVNIEPTNELLLELGRMTPNNRVGWAKENNLSETSTYGGNEFYVFSSGDKYVVTNFSIRDRSYDYYTLGWSDKEDFESFFDILNKTDATDKNCQEYYQLEEGIFLCKEGYYEPNEDYRLKVIAKRD
jgi:hypothetical protein